MGNLCNCFVPENVDDDYDFEINSKSEKRRSPSMFYSSLKEPKCKDNSYVNIDAIARYSRNSSLDMAKQPLTQQQEDEDEEGGIFTISSASLPSPVTSCINSEEEGEFLFSSNNRWLDTVEFEMKSFRQPIAAAAKRKIWSLGGPDLIMYLSPSNCEHLSSHLSMTESFDSGFSSTATASTISTTLMTTSQTYFVLQQPVETAAPRSIFYYLFDLSVLIREVLFEWPTVYLSKIKQNFMMSFAETRQRMLKYRYRYRSKPQKLVDDNLQIEKPSFSILSILSKLNLFNLFRATVSTMSSFSSLSSSPYGFNPLRDFFLRLFDINIF